MILRKAIPACAESFCVRACCNAPQRQFDLRTRCFTKIITICLEVACDKNKNIPKLAPRLRLRLFMFSHTDLRGFGFYLNPNLVNVIPAHSFTQKPTARCAGRGVRSHHSAETEKTLGSDGGLPGTVQTPHKPRPLRCSPHRQPVSPERGQLLCPAPSALALLNRRVFCPAKRWLLHRLRCVTTGNSRRDSTVSATDWTRY